MKKLVPYLHLARTYAPYALVVFLLAIYGFLFFRITSLTSQEPDVTAVSAELQTVGIPKVDQEVVSKMLTLKDNSVNVQTLFEAARSDPFEE